ncbi:hypothetical protein MLD38_021714 [Melastoma candidum]|uniref:Uncharacterized protein n=1 Tax=Melastoma candidum TaxID=119954 RepID=A0ACB9QI55_9MYRT|nr:hypothetical protein MLD38_021714 [Melastoma candidum]
MARFSLFRCSLIVFLVASICFVEVAQGGGEGSLRPDQCAGACDYRCSATSHRKPCLFFCNKCCAKCLCVPSGTYGNRQECPCYDNWKTQEGKHKCP